MTPIHSELNTILGANPDQHVTNVQQRTRVKLEQHHHSLILFGTGHLGRIALKDLFRIGKPPVAFADNNPAFNGSEINSIPVLLPKEAFERFPDSLFVVTVYTNTPVIEQLRAMGAETITFAELAWCYPDVFLPRAGLELPDKLFAQAGDIRAAFELWGDETSQQEFVRQIEWRLTLDRSVLPPHLPAKDTYFPEDLFDFNAADVFVDCGAFDGDSIRAFLQQRNGEFTKAIGLEPDPMNRARFEKWLDTLPLAERNKIQLLPFAVGERCETLLFDVTGTAASSVGAGKYEVECVSLDTAITNPPPTFIKMDIEGAELSAVSGATQILRDHQPILAICLYHTQEHLWQIPLLIHALNPNYSLFLRRYSDENWEIVCYAIPKSRCKI